MDVSIWWVIAASFLGVWTGFMLFAMLAMSKDQQEREKPLTRQVRVQSFG
jgi:hypothetical protein